MAGASRLPEDDDRIATRRSALHSSAVRFALDRFVKSARGRPVTSMYARDGFVVSSRIAGVDWNRLQEDVLIRRRQKAQRSRTLTRRAAPSGHLMSGFGSGTAARFSPADVRASTMDRCASSKSICSMPVIDVIFSYEMPAVSLFTGSVIGAAVPNASVGIFITSRELFDCRPRPGIAASLFAELKCVNRGGLD